VDAAETRRLHKGDVSSSARLLGAAIAAFVLFVLGVKLVPSPDVETVAASRASRLSPAPPTQPTLESVTPTPQRTPAPPPTLTTIRDVGAMLMGPQTVQVGGVELTFDVPEPGWEQFGNVYISKSFRNVSKSDVVIYWTPIEGDVAMPCSPLVGPASGLSVEDQAVALRGAEGLDWDHVNESGTAWIGGQPAGYLTATVREASGCGPGYFFDWEQVAGGMAWEGPMPGDVIRLWVSDVGGTRVLIEAMAREGVLATAGRELDQIVGSIRFQ
jgi:hypothetical protein